MKRCDKRWPWLLSASAATVLTACGGGSSAPLASNSGIRVATFSDAAVSGLEYSSTSTSGVTDLNGNFEYRRGEAVSFSIGNLMLGSVVPTTAIVRPVDLVPGAGSDADARVTRILQTLQSLDSDGDPETNGIHIEEGARQHLRSASSQRVHLDDENTRDEEVARLLPSGAFTVDALAARAHSARHHDDESKANLGYAPGSTRTVTLAAPAASTTGRLLASNCFQCHGTGAMGGFENIRGGQASEVFEYTRKLARSDIMAAHAQGFTRAQLEAIVTYLNQ